MSTARTSSIQRLWRVLHDAGPLCSLSMRSDEAPAAAQERVARLRHAKNPLSGWRIEDRSQGPVLHLIASDTGLWCPGGTLALRGEITPDGAGTAMQIACFETNRDPRPDPRRLAIEVAVGLLFIAAVVALSRSTQDFSRILVVFMVILGPARIAWDYFRKRKTERAARDLREWLERAFLPADLGERRTELLRF